MRKGHFKAKIASLVVKRLMVYLAARLPFLTWGPLSPIVSLILEKLVIKMLEQTFLGAQVAFVCFDVNRELNAVEGVIREVMEHEGELSDSEIEAFDNRLARASLDFMRFGAG